VTRGEKTTVIYARSTTSSRTGYRSLIAQQEVCRSYAEARGWRIGKVFADVGTWGTQRYRWRMTQLLEAVREGTVERVLIARPDRLAAVQADRTAIMHILAEWDVPCVPVEQPVRRGRRRRRRSKTEEQAAEPPVD
jgi:predicted site-specific integrase-resolvase